MNPLRASWLLPGMDSWFGFVALVAVWIALQTWVLPKLGVPT
jgi:hypothetical protein